MSPLYLVMSFQQPYGLIYLVPILWCLLQLWLSHLVSCNNSLACAQNEIIGRKVCSISLTSQKFKKPYIVVFVNITNTVRTHVSQMVLQTAYNSGVLQVRTT